MIRVDKNPYQYWLESLPWGRESETAESSVRREDTESTRRDRLQAQADNGASHNDEDSDIVSMYSQHYPKSTIKANQMLELIGRQHAGPSSTPSDGNCCLHAAMGRTLKEDDITNLRAHVSRIMEDTTSLRQSLQDNNRLDYLDKVKVGSVHHASHLTSHAHAHLLTSWTSHAPPSTSSHAFP